MSEIDTEAPPRMLADMMKANPDAFKFGDIQPEIEPEADIPIQRILGGYLPLPGKPGWYTREMTLRQEIALTDQLDTLQNLEGKSQSHIVRTMIPICRLVIYRANDAGDIVPSTDDDILDNFKSADLLDLMKDLTGMIQAAEVGDDGDLPTPAHLTTARFFGGS